MLISAAPTPSCAPIAAHKTSQWRCDLRPRREDLPDASFAGQQETFLNVTGADDVVRKVKEVFASLYNDRAIAYRVHHGFAHEDVFLSAGIQLMVRSMWAAQACCSRWTPNRFRDVVFVTASFGLGEMVGRGQPG